MIKAIIFMIKIGLFIAACLWIADHPGFVTFEWLDYKITAHVGFLLVLLFLFAIYIVNGVFRLNVRMRAKQGHRALTLGLTAVAAGDVKRANTQAKKATKLLPKDKGLTLLLSAQSARMAGREEEAAQSFAALLQNKDAAFLGVRGLLQAAIDQDDFDQAREFAYDALKLHPKQPWILSVVYDLEIQMRHWSEAQKILRRLEKIKAIDAVKAKSDRVAMVLAQADDALEADLRDEAFVLLKQAYKLDQMFAPTVLRLGKMYVQRGSRGKAVTVVEKVWRENPHPELAYVWGLAAPKKAASDAKQRLAWFEKLLRLNEESVESYIAIARAAMEDSLWDDARKYLDMAVGLVPDRRAYRLLAELEKRTAGNEDAIAKWHDKEQNAPLGRVWICGETGRAYLAWSAIAPPQGSFNTITWDVPQAGGIGGFVAANTGGADTLLEFPIARKA